MKNVKKTWVALALMGCMQVLHAQTVYLHSDNPQMRWKLKPQAEVGTDGNHFAKTDIMFLPG